MKKSIKKLNKGFTLVELVVVIAILAVLAAVSVGSYFGITASAHRRAVESETTEIRTVIQTNAVDPDSTYFSYDSTDHVLIVKGTTTTDVDVVKTAVAALGFNVPSNAEFAEVGTGAENNDGKIAVLSYKNTSYNVTYYINFADWTVSSTAPVTE